MFTAFAGSWFQAAKLTASDGAAGDEFGAIGTSVAISGTTAIVGSQFHTVSGHAGQGRPMCSRVAEVHEARLPNRLPPTVPPTTLLVRL